MCGAVLNGPKSEPEKSHDPQNARTLFDRACDPWIDLQAIYRPNTNRHSNRIENYAYYYADNPDDSKLAGAAQASPPVSTKTFSSFIGLADIVRVNGTPAKGWSIRATTTNYTPTPQPEQAISDTTRNFFTDWVWEIQQVDGTPVGTIMATRMGFGPPPPGSPSGLSPTAASTMAITGGTGSVPGNAWASRLITDYRDRTRCLGNRRSFDPKSPRRWNA